MEKCLGPCGESMNKGLVARPFGVRSIGTQAGDGRASAVQRGDELFVEGWSLLI
jgi:hypothetical protein